MDWSYSSFFPVDQIDALRRAGYWRDESCWWYLRSLAAIQPAVDELLNLIKADKEKHVDRIDRACERLLLEARLAEGEPHSHSQVALGAIRDIIDQQFSKDIDYNALAARISSLQPIFAACGWRALAALQDNTCTNCACVQRHVN